MQITDYLIIALHITKVYLKSCNTRNKDYLRVALIMIDLRLPESSTNKDKAYRRVALKLMNNNNI